MDNHSPSPVNSSENQGDNHSHKQPEPVSAEQESRRQPLWHVVVLTILTCTAYLFYWFYKNWRDLSQQAAEDDIENPFRNISPMLRTIGLMIPVLNIYMSLTQIKGIAEIHPDANAYPRRHPLVASGIIVGAIIGFQFLVNLPGLFFLLSFLVGFPLAVAQNWLNAYWNSVEPGNLLVRHAFTVKEMVAIVAGSVVLGLIVAGMMIRPS